MPALRDSLGEDPTLPDRLLPTCSPSVEPLTPLGLRAWAAGPIPAQGGGHLPTPASWLSGMGCW